MIVAIDGPAGTGKSTVAHRTAAAARLFYLNSGNFYRAITWKLLRAGLERSSESEMVEAIRDTELLPEEIGILANGRHMIDELREPAVNDNVAEVSSCVGIREVVNTRLREYAGTRDTIAEGRDMTTVVFPDAEVRVYLDASIESRAARRFAESNDGLSLAEVQQAIADRDHIDKTKPFGALKLDPSALYIDSSNLTVSQVCDIVLNAILRTRTKSTSTGAIGQS